MAEKKPLVKREDLAKKLDGVALLLEQVLAPGVLETKEVMCHDCPHGSHAVRANLIEFKAKTELSAVHMKVLKWATVLRGQSWKAPKEGSEDDGH